MKYERIIIGGGKQGGKTYYINNQEIAKVYEVKEFFVKQ